MGETAACLIDPLINEPVE